MTAAQPRPESAPAIVSHYFIIGTAGHIDHGKTSLVKALTGVNTDRLPEEQRRGMTIELGFAELVIGDTHFGVVDVPGHERFVRTMVAGATGIDIAMLVIAADDSVMPQTVEHVDILRLLGVKRGIVAITKIDSVDATLVELVEEEVRQLLAGTALERATLCRVSSVTGEGIDHLKNALVELSRSLEHVEPAPPFRMAIDRVFTVQGRGTVVTGSVLRGKVSKADTLELWPAGITCRVRDLQTHGSQHELLERGQRAAINLSGIDKESIERGFELATPGYLQATRMLDVSLSTLPSPARPLKSNSSARLEMGTAETLVRVVLYQQGPLAAGQKAYAQLRTHAPVTAVHGQRFILRDENGLHTIGGGTVLRPVARRRKRTASEETEKLRALEQGDALDRAEEVLRSYGFRQPTDLHLSAEAGIELEQIPRVLTELQANGRWIAIQGMDSRATPGAVDDLTHRLVGWLERYHKAHPELPGRPIDAVVGWVERMTGAKSVGRALYEELVRGKAIKSIGKYVCAPAFAPSLSQADEKYLAALLNEIRAGAFQPPSLPELSFASQIDRKRLDRLVTLAVALGELVSIDGTIYLHAAREVEMRRIVAELIARHDGATVAEIREALSSSRKYAVPFVEYLDRMGFTKRVGDKRELANRTP